MTAQDIADALTSEEARHIAQAFLACIERFDRSEDIPVFVRGMTDIVALAEAMALGMRAAA